MTFNHIKSNFKWPKVKRKNINGVRHYVDEQYNIYHSVTKVVNKDKDFSDWYKKLSEQYKCSPEAGEAIGNYVMIQSGIIGTALHSACEDYLNNKIGIKSDNLLVKAHFENIKPLINTTINNIRGLEVQMFSKEMGLAGTVDCVAEYTDYDNSDNFKMDTKLSVIDFKTSKKAKPEEWIESYFLQATCYALMWEENTGEKIDQIVILMTGEDGSQTVYKKDKAQYIDRLYQVIEEFKSNTNV